MFTYNGLNPATNRWNVSAINDYREMVSYDANGKIVTYKCNGDAARAISTGMDALSYTYKPGTNRLDKVADAAPDALPSEYERYNDIKKGQSTGNYQYDAIGNLTSDASEGITNIEWSVYGKIKSITKGSGTITYTYDAAGNRISKTANGKTAWYVRDATGNIMSIYEKGDTLKQKEINLYGSSRLGVYNVDIDVQTCNAVSPEVVTFTRGNKFFELTNHLGNVLATVSDKKLQHTTNGTSIVYYTADVMTAHNYYPFGMIMPGIPGREGSPVETPEVPDSLMEEDHYDTGVGGWAVYSSCVIVNDNGRVKVSAGQVWGTPMKPLHLVKGKRYRIRFTIDMGNCGEFHTLIYNAANQTYEIMPETGISIKTSGAYEGTFTASADDMLFLFEMIPGANPPPDSTGYFWIDDFSLEEITPPYGLTSRNYWTIVKADSGRIKVLSTSAWGEAHKILKITTGKQYRLRYNLDMGNCSDLHVIVSNPADGTYTFPAETGLGITQSGNYMGTFTAAADSVELRFQMPAMPSGADTGYFWLDDVWIDEVIPYEGGGVSGSDRGYRYGFNGKEQDTEISGDGNQYDYGFRIYDPRIGRFKPIDPLTNNFPSQSPYVAFDNNPTNLIDPDGRAAMPPDEFDQNGNKISNLGGDKIDFYHQKNGDTKIVDRKTGAINMIVGGESLIRNYTLRDKSTGWGQITKEFFTGKGPTNSLLADFDNSNEGAFGSLHSNLSSYSTLARKASLNSTDAKGLIKMSYGNANPFLAQDMWEQMWGRSDVSWYKLGDKTLFLMNDSKSWKSLTLRAGTSWERSEKKEFGNTYQTYIWIESNADIQSKVIQNNAYYQKHVQQLRQEIRMQKF